MKFRKDSLFFLIVILGSMLPVLSSCSGKHWIVVKEDGCTIYDPDPIEGQVLVWSGECKRGHAQGYGVLSVYEKNQRFLTCEGNARRGQLHGFIVFTVYKNDQVQFQYEDTWVKGRLVKRLRNVTMEKSLSSAETAREYLFLLKKYEKEYPDAWMDDFHQALLEKVVFACKALEVNRPVEKRVEAGKIYKDELLFKVYNHDISGFTYYTVYNHRIASLKELVNDIYIPGGDQFYTNDASVLCGKDNFPTELPDRYAPIILSENGEMVFFMDKDSTQRPFWYPKRKP